MSSLPIITATGINHYYGQGPLRRQILFDISVEVYPGEIVIMTGPSGSGKTTLLTLMGGLRSVQEGSLKILDYEMRGASNRRLERLRKQIGFIFQAHNLLTSLTALQNVQMATVLYPTSMKRSQKQARAMLEAVGLGERLHSLPDQLSGGQKQRVAIARALVNQPQIILADEPTAALDRTSGREVVEIMQRLAQQQGCTILMVTHDNRILDIADRIISLEDGYLSASKGELLLNMNNVMTTVLTEDVNTVKSLIEPLSIPQFSGLLGKLNGEFDQLLSAMKLLEDRSLQSKLDVTLQAIALKIAQILQAEHVTFFVVDHQTQILWSKNAIGKGGMPISLEIPITAGIAGHVATTGESVNVPDPYQDPRFNPQVDQDTGFQTHNILCLPMLDGKQVNEKQANEQQLNGKQEDDHPTVFAVVQALNKLGDGAFTAEDEARFFELVQSLGPVLQTSILQAQKGRAEMTYSG